MDAICFGLEEPSGFRWGGGYGSSKNHHEVPTRFVLWQYPRSILQVIPTPFSTMALTWGLICEIGPLF